MTPEKKYRVQLGKISETEAPKVYYGEKLAINQILDSARALTDHLGLNKTGKNRVGVTTELYVMLDSFDTNSSIVAAATFLIQNHRITREEYARIIAEVP